MTSALETLWVGIPSVSFDDLGMRLNQPQYFSLESQSPRHGAAYLWVIHCVIWQVTLPCVLVLSYLSVLKNARKD